MAGVWIEATGGFWHLGRMNQPLRTTAETFDRLAQRAFFGFVVTFILSRSVVFLIMSHHIPNLYCFLQGTHVHHLNYGIFLLSAVGGYVLFARPAGRAAELSALTFDEFGMWLHLGGSYWQRVSVDAVMIVAALLGLIAYAPKLEQFESHHRRAFVILVLVVLGFGVVIYTTSVRVSHLVGPELRELESSSSP